MATLTVGAGQTYASLSAAAAAAASGDTIDVLAGTYVNDFAVLPANVTVQSVGGMADFTATTASPTGAILTTTTGDSLYGLDLSASPGVDITALHHLGGYLSVGTCYIHDATVGFSADSDALSILDIYGSEIASSATNVVVGTVAYLMISSSYIHDATDGDEILSTASVDQITYTSIAGTAAAGRYLLDLPDAGDVLLNFDTLADTAPSDGTLIDFGSGSVPAGQTVTQRPSVSPADQTLLASQNVVEFLGTLAAGAAVVLNRTPTPVQVAQNAIYGAPKSATALGRVWIDGATSYQPAGAAPAITFVAPWRPVSAPSVTLDDPPTPVEKGQTAALASVAAGIAGDSLELLLTGPAPAGTVWLSGGQVLYRAPATITAAYTDTIAFEIVDLTYNVTTGATASVTLDPGPKLTAVTGTPSTAPGGSVILGTVTPGVAGDTLTITPVGSLSGTLSLDAAGEVVYTAPASAAGTTSVAVKYKVVDEAGGVSVTASKSVKVVPAATLVMAALPDPPLGTPEPVASIKPRATTDIVTATTLTAPHYGRLAISGDTLTYTQTAALPVGVADTAVAQLSDTAGGLSVKVTAIVAEGGNLVLTSDASGLTSIGIGDGNDTVTLKGVQNMVVAGQGNDVVTGGSGTATIRLGSGADTVMIGGGGNHVTLGSGNDIVSFATAGNFLTIGSGIDSVSGKSGDKITLTGAHGQLTLSGSKESVAISSAGAGETVIDHGAGTQLLLSPGCGTVTLSDALADPTLLIDLKSHLGGFTTATAALAAVVSDGSGGSVLSLGTGAALHVLGAAPGALHASNFKIG